MKVIFKGIGKLFGWIGKGINILRQVITNLLFFVVIGAWLFIFNESSKGPELPEKAALVLDISGPIVERQTPVNAYNELVKGALVNHLHKRPCCLTSSIPFVPLQKMTALPAWF
ncbi:signal peptide peptidase SppA [Photobacterium aphoticum]|uniref:Signal peptide peptidase SppA n=1 Tax=Photobacterium aphoticum TaxID=754436 RepID=A0A090QZ38_9GAMM|nr:signal peptide peptidase SppA [Photobacterium aphoticum]